MSAPQQVYINKSLKGSNGHRVLIAKKLSEYGSIGNFKNKFHLDRVEDLVFADGSKGIQGFVLPGGNNARYHDMTTYKGLLTHKDGNTYVSLNDAGLNTTPDIDIEIPVRYRNYVRVNMQVASAYYSPTRNQYTATMQYGTVNGNVSKDIKNEFTGLSEIPQKEYRMFYANDIFISPSITSGTITVSASAVNEIGTIDISQQTDVWTEEIYLGGGSFGDGHLPLFSWYKNLPSNYVEYSDNANNGKLFMTKEDYGKLGSLVRGEHVATPAIVYKDIYMMHGSGVTYENIWMLYSRNNQDGNTTFIHINGHGQADQYQVVNIPFPAKVIIFDMREKIELQPSDPDLPTKTVKKYVSFAEFEENYPASDKPDSVTMKGKVVAVNQNGQVLENAIKFPILSVTGASYALEHTERVRLLKNGSIDAGYDRLVIPFEVEILDTCPSDARLKFYPITVEEVLPPEKAGDINIQSRGVSIEKHY